MSLRTRQMGDAGATPSSVAVATGGPSRQRSCCLAVTATSSVLLRFCTGLVNGYSFKNTYTWRVGRKSMSGEKRGKKKEDTLYFSCDTKIFHTYTHTYM